MIGLLKTNILLLVILFAVNLYSYQLEKNVKLADTDSTTTITLINDTALVVQSPKKALLLTGSDFATSSEHYSSEGQMKVSKKGIASLSKDGSYISLTKYAKQNYTFLEKNLTRSMVVTSKYLLVGKENDRLNPILKKLNFDTIEFETIIFTQTLSKPYFQAIGADLKNGDIAFSFSNDLLLIDNQTLKIKQIMKGNNVSDYVRSIFIYQDKKTNESRYLIGRSASISIIVSDLKKDIKTGNYTASPLFYSYSITEKFSISLTGLNTAISTKNCELTYYDNLSSIIDISSDIKYLMSNRIQVAVSYDQTFFVLRNGSGFYEVYSLSETYEVTLKLSIYVNYNDFVRGATTSDDKYLFVSMSNTRGKRNIARVDVKEGQFALVIDNDGSSDNQICFYLFHAKYNQFVVLTQRNATSYYLQLRNIDDLKIISQLRLQLNFTGLEFKMIGNVQWQKTFALAVRIKDIYHDLENDTKLYLFNIVEDRIVNLNNSKDVTFNYLEACYRYIIFYKQRFPQIKILHFSNLSLAHIIKPLSLYGDDLKCQKNVFIDSQDKKVIYNFSESFQLKGWIYSYESGLFPEGLSIIFPKRGLLYQGATKQFHIFRYIMTKKISNISSPLVKSSFVFYDKNYCFFPIYYLSQQKNKGPSCNFVFYIEFEDDQYITKLPYLKRYNECTQQIEGFPVIGYTQEVDSKAYVSTDKKYVSILVKPWFDDQFLLEIRLISQLEKIIFHKFFPFSVSQDYSLDQYQIDVVRDNLIIIKSSEFLTAYFIEPKEFADSNRMTSITPFDYTDENILAFAGPSIKDPKATSILVKNVSSAELIFETNVFPSIESIAVSPLGQMLAVYNKDSVLSVWNTVSKETVFTKSVHNLTKMEFGGENVLLLQTKSKYEVIDLSLQRTLMSKAYVGSGRQISINKEGSLIAEISSDTSVDIYSNEGELITNLGVSEGKIQKVGFMEKDIVIINGGNKVHIWKNTEKKEFLTNQRYLNGNYVETE